MESPKRKAQKSRDYRRHRMMRLLNRRKATAQKAMSEIAERKLMRRLRITPLKKFKDGKDTDYDAREGGIKKYVGDLEDITYDADNMKFYEKATGKELGDSAILNEVIVNGRNRANDYLTEANDNTSVYNIPHREYNQHLKDRTEQSAREAAIWREEHPNLSAWGEAAASIPLAVASVPLIAGGAEALAGTSAGQAASSALLSLSNLAKGSTIAGAPAWAWADAGLTSAFAANGASEIAKGNITPEALMEVAPLGRLTKPLYKGVLKSGIRQYNPRHVIKQITAENAASMTPEQWTAAQDAAIAKALNITPEEIASLTKEQYEAAIARGINTEELSRLRLLHNSVKAPNNKIRVNRGKGEPFVLHHDTDNKPWNVYDDSYFGKTDEGWYGKGLYLSGAPFGKNAYGKNTMKLFANVENPVYAKDNFEVGLTKQFFNRGIPKEDALKILESSLEPNELELFLKHKKSITKALDRVYNADGVIVPLNANGALNRPYSPYHEVVVPDGRKVKSADAVTFNDNGVRIPLGERDNFNINDIRYDINDPDFESFTIPVEDLQTSLNAPINNPVIINGKEYPTMKTLMNKVEMIKPNELNAAHQLAQKEIRTYLESPEYRQRLIDNGFDPDKYISALEHYLDSRVKYGDLNSGTRGVTEIVNGEPEITLNNSVFDTDYDTLIHELAHAQTKNLDHSMYVKNFIDARLKNIMQYNEKILPQLDKDVAARHGVSIDKLTYLNDPQEIRARMISVIMDARRKGVKLSEYIDRVKSNRQLNDLKSFLKVDDIKKYGASVLSVTPFAIPLTKKNKQNVTK